MIEWLLSARHIAAWQVDTLKLSQESQWYAEHPACFCWQPQDAPAEQPRRRHHPHCRRHTPTTELRWENMLSYTIQTLHGVPRHKSRAYIGRTVSYDIWMLASQSVWVWGCTGWYCRDNVSGLQNGPLNQLGWPNWEIMWPSLDVRTHFTFYRNYLRLWIIASLVLLVTFYGFQPVILQLTWS